MKFPRLLPALAALMVATVPAGAHHSFPSEFDGDVQGEISGTVTKVWFRNPHVRYRLAVTAEDGSVEEWDVQTTSVTSIRRAGWTPETLMVGESVRIWGDMGRNQTKKIFMRGVEKEDGTELYPSGPTRNRGDRDRVTVSAGIDYGYAKVNKEYRYDISGPWRNNYKFQLTVDDLEPKPTPFSDEGRKKFEATEAWQDGVLRCLPLGLPRVFGSPYNMEIVDAGTHYVILYQQNNTPRRIWMDGRKAPADRPPTSMGFSVGRWDGDTLIIETTHLTEGTLDGSLLPMDGEGTRIVERWEMTDGGLAMDRIMTIHDPNYTEPLVRRRGSARAESVEIIEQAPCDPDGYYQDLLQSGRLREHLGVE
jgi:hypothetical protein